MEKMYFKRFSELQIISVIYRNSWQQLNQNIENNLHGFSLLGRCDITLSKLDRIRKYHRIISKVIANGFLEFFLRHNQWILIISNSSSQSRYIDAKKGISYMTQIKNRSTSYRPTFFLSRIFDNIYNALPARTFLWARNKYLSSNTSSMTLLKNWLIFSYQNLSITIDIKAVWKQLELSILKSIAEIEATDVRQWKL